MLRCYECDSPAPALSSRSRCIACEEKRARANELENEQLREEVNKLTRSRNEYAAHCDELRTCLESLVEESDGVAGYHLNGDIADWDELDVTWLLGEIPKASLQRHDAEVAKAAIMAALRNFAPPHMTHSHMEVFAREYASRIMKGAPNE